MTDLEADLLFQVQAAGLPEPKQQYRFHGSRRWLADFCWPSHRLIVEVMGGTFAHMAHSTGTGIHRDYEKSNAAQLMGYTYLQFDRQMIEDGSALATIQQVIGGVND